MNLLWLSYGRHLAAARRLASCLELSWLSWVPWPGWGFAGKQDSQATGWRFSGCATVAPVASLQPDPRLRSLRSPGCLWGFGSSARGFRRSHVPCLTVLDLSMAWPCSGLNGAGPLSAKRRWHRVQREQPRDCPHPSSVRASGVSGAVPLPAPAAVPFSCSPTSVSLWAVARSATGCIYRRKNCFSFFLLFFLKWFLEVKNSCLIQLLGVYHKLVTCNKLAHLLVCQHSQKQTKWLVD